MKRLAIVLCALLVVLVVSGLARVRPDVAGAPALVQSFKAAQNANVPKIPFESVPEPLQVLRRHESGRGALGRRQLQGPRAGGQSSRAAQLPGPLYGNASTQLLEFDETGKFVREVGHGVYGLGYAHSARYDKYDNLWIVDKGTHSVMRFNPAGYVTLNLGRRPEGPDEPELLSGQRPGAGWRRRVRRQEHVDGMFRAPTDIAFDSDDNIYISDGYINSRVAKFDKHGNWIKSWGSRGVGGQHADQNPGQFNTPAQHRNRPAEQRLRRGPREPAHPGVRPRRQFPEIHLPQRALRQDSGIPCSATWQPNPPDETQPWTICITQGPTQYLYTSDSGAGPHLQADAGRQNRRDVW